MFLPNDFLPLLPLYVLVTVAGTIINLRYQNDCLSPREYIICQDLALAFYNNEKEDVCVLGMRKLVFD